MENNAFKTVTFGGFDKQDVIHYIEETAREAAQARQALQQERDSLREQLESQSGQLEHLRAEVESISAQRDALAVQLEQETSRRQSLESAKPEADRLAAEAERLRPDAVAYAQFRERIGAIECEARKRAADLEAETVVRLEKMVAQFQEQYRDLASSFNATAAHVTGELRKVEVNLTQLPRAMDRAGVELEELAALMEKRKNEE